MNKTQGVTVGAILAASFALHPAMTTSPAAAPQAAGAEVKPTTLMGAARQRGPSRDGPWLASCRYWAPARSVDTTEAQQDEAKEKTPEIRGELMKKNHELDVYLDMKGTERDWGCGGETTKRWGLPGNETVLPGQKTKHALKSKQLPNSSIEGKPKYQPHVMAVIATVPDPIHTHLALSFDRAIVAILEAASDNHYVSSSYWLPWTRHGGAPRGAEAAGEPESGHDPEREQEPGLIVLKHVPVNRNTKKDPSESFYNVIYLFLVAETPTQGVDGFQLANAFTYEKELADELNDKQPCADGWPNKSASESKLTRGRNCEVSIIGPLYTGSAASLRAGIEDAHRRDKELSTFDVKGGTTSPLAVDQIAVEAAKLTEQQAAAQPAAGAAAKKAKARKCKVKEVPETPLQIKYNSFDANGDYAARKFIERTAASGMLVPDTPYPRVAKLSEDNSTLGVSIAFDICSDENANADKDHKDPRCSFKNTDLTPKEPSHHADAEEFRFPREISLLRNAQMEANSSGNNAEAAPSPYLKLSGKDTGDQDELPQFSRDNTPLSQEAELMTLARQLQHDRVRYLIISTPSSALDQVFLARFLHRSAPDTRLVFIDSDLLMVREVDSAPFLGSITVSPFPMIGMDDRAYSDTEGVAYYNASSMTFWRMSEVRDLRDALETSYGDRSYVPGEDYQPSLWATVIGTDGYYPLGQLSVCASDKAGQLPTLDKDGHAKNQECGKPTAKTDDRDQLDDPYPVSKLWIGVALFVGLMCAVHSAMLWKARYWSTVTRNLALKDNDELGPRAVYVQIGGAVLFLMAYVVTCPVLALYSMSDTSLFTTICAAVLLLIGMGSLVRSLIKTLPALSHTVETDEGAQVVRRKQATLVYGLVYAECLLLAGVWTYLCWSNTPLDPPSYRGLAFSYRCIHPESGVSPLVPVLLLLFSWHLWSLLQTGRLRFSELGRPSIPGELKKAGDSYFVARERLEKNREDGTRSLYSNLSETFVVQRLFWKQTGAVPPGKQPEDKKKRADEQNKWESGAVKRLMKVKWVSFGLTIGVPSLLAILPLFSGVDHFLWNTGKLFPSPYEALVGLLFYPLFLMAVLGWGRVLLVWFSLRRDLLDRLENQPIRFSFNRLKGMGWMALMQQGAVYEHWRDMARSLESIRQMLHQSEMRSDEHHELAAELTGIQKTIATQLEVVRKRFVGPEPGPTEQTSPQLMNYLELSLSKYAQILLEKLLIPYWDMHRVGLVESDLVEAMPVRARRSETRAESELAMEVFAEPEAERNLIAAAEEYIALRYIALIRAVLTNLRYVMAFISAFFVLSIVAWNSYPFEPRELVDWLTTGLLVLLGAGMVWVFAQMHRNPILSRATDTKANELGWDFYLRIATFGAIPLLTWLAYAFPQVGGMIYRIVQPGVEVLK